MNPALSLKLFLYRTLSSSPGRSLLRLLGKTASIPYLPKGTGKRKHPFLVVITTDTEAGYVAPNERRVWQHEAPSAYQGYHTGINNLLEIFERHEVKTTFFLSTHCFSASGQELEKVKSSLGSLLSKGHELGAHFHPDSDQALKRHLGQDYKATSAFLHADEDKQRIVRSARELVRMHLGQAISSRMMSARWGNWALDGGAVKALENSGFMYDSSATPGIKGHLKDGRRFDWSECKRHYPWRLSAQDHQDIALGDTNVTEFPIATFSVFGRILRADPVNSSLLMSGFDAYYRGADRSKKPFPFVVITHSPEATMEDGSPTRAARDLDRFIRHAKRHRGVEFVTLEEAANRYGRV